MVVVFLALVLIYQAWTYYVFRRRVSESEFPVPPRPRTPADEGTGSPVPRIRPTSHRKT